MKAITKTQIEKAQQEAYKGFGLGRVTVKTARERVEVRLAFAGKRDPRLSFILYGIEWARQTTRISASAELMIRALSGKAFAQFVAAIYVNRAIRNMEDVKDFLNGKPMGFSL